MVSQLPPVRLAALEHRGPGKLALHLAFERPLRQPDHGIILVNLGEIVLNQGLPAFQPTFDGDNVRLDPVAHVSDDALFAATARHFGADLPDGDLPFIQDGMLIAPAARLRQ
jgi:hypothetical protein